MTKRSKKEVSASELAVLERIYREKEGVSIPELAKEYDVGQKTMRNYVEDLLLKIPIIEVKGGKVCAVPTTLRQMWSGTPIGDRLGPSPSKGRLAKGVFLFIEQHKEEIGRLILGAGTTVCECARELMSGASRLGHMRIHTANLLVLHEFVCQKPSNLWIESPSGEVNLNTAALWDSGIAKYFQDIEAQAVVTSFSDMSFEKGFCTIHHDIEEKRANLKPNPQTCKWVIIPIEWKRMARSANNPVANSRERQLEVIDGRRKYIIITDKPSQEEWNAEIDDKKLADLDKWKKEYKDGIEIIFA